MGNYGAVTRLDDAERLEGVNDHYVCYCVTDKIGGAIHNRRTGPFGEDTAAAFAKDLARREQISSVAIERWAMVERVEVRG